MFIISQNNTVFVFTEILISLVPKIEFTFTPALAVNIKFYTTMFNAYMKIKNHKAQKHNNIILTASPSRPTTVYYSSGWFLLSGGFGVYFVSCTKIVNRR